ncbi:hypothetical protein L2E82_45648 [Cichorium intybus]|uniref:Uncharacterized protein n=1 Tax=Cichorium intybus TaxID=13427 RepID=A0ACB8ZUJ3_CICIN|nr:hypothetical protein L2E82_45648 [Cichorium intybus]
MNQPKINCRMGKYEVGRTIDEGTFTKVKFGRVEQCTITNDESHGVYNDLQDGELIHGEIFNLFAAMSAVEIIDPKMDSGIVCRYYYVDEAIEDGAALSL